MLELLRNPEAKMRKVAINWLGFMGGDDRLIDLLLKHARYDRSIQVQTQAARTVTILLARTRRFQSILPLLRDHPVSVALGLCVVARRGQLPPEGIRLLAMLRQHPEVTRKRNIRRQIESALRRSITEIDRER